MHSLRINEAGLVVQAGQLGHELSFNAGIIVDSILNVYHEEWHFSIDVFRYNTTMIKFSGYYIPLLERDERRRH